MPPQIHLLSEEIVARVQQEAFDLIAAVGVKVQAAAARELLLAAGAQPGSADDVIRIPEPVARRALTTVPAHFNLYDRQGRPAVHYGGDAVQFDPGSSGVHILDSVTGAHRPSTGADLTQIIKLTEQLPQYAAQSTAIVCSEVPKEIGDLYRLYLVLLYADKPVVTGAFGVHTAQTMFDMLAIYAGGRAALAAKPLAIFDVCPTPPLIWSEFGAQNLIELARAGVPAQIVSMPLAGVAAPVTLLGAITQHAAECISGMTIHQLAQPGAPIVWGGAPAIFDMRQGTVPLGAIETAMIDAAYSQVGKAFGFPTHTYLGASDAKLVDYQAGLESGMSALIAAQAGINMISGAGMLDFLACFSPEKLVADADAIGMALRFRDGVTLHTASLATEFFANINFKADFLKQKATRQLFSKEQFLVSPVIDRGSVRVWQDGGCLDASARARTRIAGLLASYTRPSHPESEAELVALVSRLAQQAGMERLPAI
jgi:trimethylamine--corrinoid protein Co-methyltransferase